MHKTWILRTAWHFSRVPQVGNCWSNEYSNSVNICKTAFFFIRYPTNITSLELIQNYSASFSISSKIIVFEVLIFQQFSDRWQICRLCGKRIIFMGYFEFYLLKISLLIQNLPPKRYLQINYIYKPIKNYSRVAKIFVLTDSFVMMNYYYIERKKTCLNPWFLFECYLLLCQEKFENNSRWHSCSSKENKLRQIFLKRPEYRAEVLNPW